MKRVFLMLGIMLFSLGASLFGSTCDTAPTINGYNATLDSTGTVMTFTVDTGTSITDATYLWSGIYKYIYEFGSPVQDTAGASGVHTWVLSGDPRVYPGITIAYGVRVRKIQQAGDPNPGQVCPSTAANGTAWKYTPNNTTAMPTVTQAIPAGTGFTYQAKLVGPAHIYQGSNAYYKSFEQQLSGSCLYGAGGCAVTNQMKHYITGDAAFMSTVNLKWYDSIIPSTTADAVSTTTYTNDTKRDYGHFATYQVGLNEFEIDTTSSTPVGTYTVTMWYCDVSMTLAQCQAGGTGTHGIQSGSASISITVLAPATFTVTPPSSYPPIPDLGLTSTHTYPHCSPGSCGNGQAPSLEEAIPYYAAGWCAQDTDNYDPYTRIIRANDPTAVEVGALPPPSLMTVCQSGWCQNFSWRYDFERMIDNWALYTGAYNTWDVCRENVHRTYRDDWALGGGTPPVSLGGISGIMAHTEGLVTDWAQHGHFTDTGSDLTQVSRAGKDAWAVMQISKATAYAAPSAGAFIGTNQRELALQFQSDYNAARICPTCLKHISADYKDYPYSWWVQYELDHLIGYAQQMCVDTNLDYAEFFMLGLMYEDFERYWQHPIKDASYGDSDPTNARMLTMMKACVDYADQYYNVDPNQPFQFPYDVPSGNYLLDCTAGGNQCYGTLLNAYLAQGYAFVWSVTGNSYYQTRGDRVFTAAVTNVGDGTAGTTFSGLSGTIGYGLTQHPVISWNGGKQNSQYNHVLPYVYYRTAPESQPLSASNVLPSATVNQAYSQTLTGTGGFAPYTFLVDVGSLPPGLTLNPNYDSTHGLLSGMPTTAGTYTFTIGLWDKWSSTRDEWYDQTFTMTVSPQSSTKLGLGVHLGAGVKVH